MKLIMKIFAVVGYSKSGKTTTVIEIIKELSRRGKKVGTVKAVDIENFSIDTFGKDSWKHREAGAIITATQADKETAIMYQKRMTAKELIPFFQVDFLILEGFSIEKKIPKVLCAKSIDDLNISIDPTICVISGVISKSLSEYKGIKIINSLTSIKELVDLLEQKAVNSSKI